jgi:hypothetical protein
MRGKSKSTKAHHDVAKLASPTTNHVVVSAYEMSFEGREFSDSTRAQQRFDRLAQMGNDHKVRTTSTT